MENMEKKLEERELKELELMNENENREFYVYAHIRLDNNTVFYVGKGTKNRAYDLDRGNFHNSVCKKYGCRVEIIKDNLTESQAFRLESKMIKYYVLTLGYGIAIEGYDDYDHNLPYLTNFTWGGEGTSGIIPWNKGKHQSEEAKRKNSEAHKGKYDGKKNPMFGKNAYANKTPEEMEEIGKKKSEALKGIKRSDETKRKIGEASKGRNSKKVICITTGEKFDSQTEASDHYNVATSGISLCCKGKQKHAGKLLDGTKLQWKYAEDDDNESKAV